MRGSVQTEPLAHDTVFDVYLSEGSSMTLGELFAIGEQGADIVVVERLKSGVRVSKMALQAAIARLATRLKQGYTKAPNRMYFNARAEAFTRVHPDVDWKGEKWLLAATPPSIPDAVHQVAVKVGSLGLDLIVPEEVEAWRQQQSLNATHVVAFADHPAWPLALAQLALEHGWGLRAAPGTSPCPDTPPSMAPHEWQSWLVPPFDAKTVLANQAGFGWTVGQIIVSEVAARDSGGLSALL